MKTTRYTVTLTGCDGHTTLVVGPLDYGQLHLLKQMEKQSEAVTAGKLSCYPQLMIREFREGDEDEAEMN